MFDDVVVVYKFVGDLMFYVTGHQDENEVILYSVLTAFVDSVTLLLRCGTRSTFWGTFSSLCLLICSLLLSLDYVGRLQAAAQVWHLRSMHLEYIRRTGSAFSSLYTDPSATYY